MKFEIKSIYSGEILFSLETNSMKLCVEAAIKAGANLSYASLSGANLAHANLRGANLAHANLRGANLAYADLAYADLAGADLRGVNLRGVNLRDADLAGVDLAGADLAGAKNIPDLAAAQSCILPEGNLVGWKKCRDNVIVKLLIPQRAKRSCATGRKCRAEYVQVLRVYGADAGISTHDEKTVYRKGEMVQCDNWNDDRWTECSGGIHFFITRIEAEKY